MSVEVTMKTAEPVPTAVVKATTTWAQFPSVQVTRAFSANGPVVPSTLPGGLVATAIHTGPVAKIGHTHSAVCEWARANGYTLSGPRREIYGAPDPSTGDFAVEVFSAIRARHCGSLE